jgi:3-deoxy-manno-octulosonate cytidylyltransferase (CMP-KDO synthetase)
VEQRGQDPLHNVIAVIPARYASTRLPGKLLREVAGRPLILHTLAQARKAETVSRTIIATDDRRILDLVRAEGGEAVMTRPDHASGSDRVAEVAENLPAGSIIVNVQGDEPLIAPETIDRAVAALTGDPSADIATTCEPITSVGDELLNGNVVKVVIGDRGYALYFSRSPMPFPREASLRYGGDPGQAIRSEPELLSLFRKHTGLYVYRREYLLKFSKLPLSRLERIEMLEQLRALDDGARIRVVEAAAPSIGVDTLQDLDEVRLKIEFPSLAIRQGNEDDIPGVADVYLSSVRGSFAGMLPSVYLGGLQKELRIQAISQRMQDDSYRFLVLEHLAEGIIGSIDLAFPDTDNYGYDARIFSFYIVPHFQRKGLGELLFRSCLRRIRAMGGNSVCLDTFDANRFKAFYEKMGGVIVGSSSHEIAGEEMQTAIFGWSDLSGI